MKSGNTTNFDYISTCTHDVCAHGVKEVCKVYDMRLFGRIFKDSETLCLYSGEHCVDSSADGYLIEINLCSEKKISVKFNNTVFNCII